jgi:hypothetical protein
MTQDEAKQEADKQNRFDSEAGCPFKSACIKGKCPAYIPAKEFDAMDADTQQTTQWFVFPFSCKIIRGLEKLAEM